MCINWPFSKILSYTLLLLLGDNPPERVSWSLVWFDLQTLNKMLFLSPFSFNLSKPTSPNLTKVPKTTSYNHTEAYPACAQSQPSSTNFTQPYPSLTSYHPISTNHTMYHQTQPHLSSTNSPITPIS